MLKWPGIVLRKTIFSVSDIVVPLKKEDIETKNCTLDDLGYFRKH